MPKKQITKKMQNKCKKNKSQKKMQKKCEKNAKKMRKKREKNAKKMRKKCDPTRAAKTKSKKKEKTKGIKRDSPLNRLGAPQKIAALLSPRQNLSLSKKFPLAKKIP